MKSMKAHKESSKSTAVILKVMEGNVAEHGGDEEFVMDEFDHMTYH